MQRIISSVPRRYSPGTVTEYRDVTLLSVEPSFTPPIARMSDFWPGTQSRLMWPRRATWSPSYKREKPSIKVAAAHVCVCRHRTVAGAKNQFPIEIRRPLPVVVERQNFPRAQHSTWMTGPLPCPDLCEILC